MLLPKGLEEIIPQLANHPILGYVEDEDPLHLWELLYAQGWNQMTGRVIVFLSDSLLDLMTDKRWTMKDSCGKYAEKMFS